MALADRFRTTYIFDCRIGMTGIPVFLLTLPDLAMSLATNLPIASETRFADNMLLFIKVHTDEH